MNKDNQKKTVISIVAVLTLILLVVGVTYAAFTFSNIGTTENSVTTGTVTMTYNEGDNGIIIDNAIPTTDDAGKNIIEPSQVFDFTVDISVAGKTNVSYEVAALKDESSSIADAKVRLYLERGDNSTNYNEVMAPTAYTPINSADEFGAQPGEMVLDTNTVTSAAKFYYRLKMWVAKDYLLDGTPRSYSVKINVYGIGGKATTPSKPVTSKVCRRATTLHTEECTNTDTSSYCSATGYKADGSKGTTTITYGSLGNSGTLTAGDAFDCDVNGDGNYNPETERFYYVTDQDVDTAVMVYYDNTAAGVPNNTLTFAYDAGGDSYENGPATAVAQLPTTAQWPNVSLKNTTRTLIDEYENVIKAGFSYQGYAARLLTLQELGSACNFTAGDFTQGQLDNCIYIMENTNYSSDAIASHGTWFENPSYASFMASFVDTLNRSTNITSGGFGMVDNADFFGVRPVIEVSKSDITY